MNMRSKISRNFKGVIDTTLREGLQYRFADFSLSEQMKIVKILSEIGVDYIEVGNPIVEEVREQIRSLLRVKDRKPFLSHVRNRLTDVQAAYRMGVEGVNILFTLDEERISGMNLDFDQYLTMLISCIRFAKEKKLQTRVSIENFFRSNFQKAVSVFSQAQNLEVDRIGVADTLGMVINWEVTKTIRTLRRIFSIDIEVHFHNDLGQAVSNALSALSSGANWVDTTLLGIGERTGIVPLSTFLAAIYCSDRNLVRNRYKMKSLTQADYIVASMLGQDVPFNIITNRENGFSHKAGIHLHAIVNFGPHKYEPIPPEEIGNRRVLIKDSVISGSNSKKLYKCDKKE